MSITIPMHDCFHLPFYRMDQDIAMDGEDDVDPVEDARDYAALGKNLPVFCVSSKAHQKKSGRLLKDDEVDGFPHIEDTGIPALQRHALEIVKSTRAASCRRFFLELRRYLVSLMMQVVISQQPLKLADDLRQQELSFLNEAAESLVKVRPHDNNLQQAADKKLRISRTQSKIPLITAEQRLSRGSIENSAGPSPLLSTKQRELRPRGAALRRREECAS